MLKDIFRKIDWDGDGFISPADASLANSKYNDLIEQHPEIAQMDADLAKAAAALLKALLDIK